MAKRAASRRRVQTAKPHLVFVSHATYDKFLAKVLCEKLESSVVGAATFRDDRDIDGGDSIPETIKAKIRECEELLILLTPESIQHDWIKLEIGMAEILDKRVITVHKHCSLWCFKLTSEERGVKNLTTERIINRRATLAAVVAFLGLIQFLLAVRVAAARYPGGFSFGTRFLSEMGRTDGPAGILFNGSIILLGSCLAFFFTNGFRDEESTVFRWSGILSACGLMGIGLTPLDKFFYEHHLFLILWLVPMFPMIIAATIGHRISGLPGMLLGILLLFLTVRYINSAGSNQAPWNQKLVIVAGLAWMVLAGFHVLREGLQEIKRRLRIGEDPLTESYLQKLQTDGLYPYHRRNSDQHRRY